MCHRATPASDHRHRRAGMRLAISAPVHMLSKLHELVSVLPALPWLLQLKCA